MERLTEWVSSEEETYAIPNRNMRLRDGFYLTKEEVIAGFPEPPIDD